MVEPFVLCVSVTYRKSLATQENTSIGYLMKDTILYKYVKKYYNQIYDN